MTDVPAAQVATVEAKGAKVLNSKTGGWIPLCMAIDMPPFDDVRVRQAMRLIVDRQGMIDQILSGYGFDGQRPLRTLRRRLRQRPAAARAGHRPGQVAAEGGRARRA